MNAPMTNLNVPTLRELAALNEKELDEAIARHFGPARYREQLQNFSDAMPAERKKEPMTFEPVWYQRRAGFAVCGGAGCRQGRDECPTPDACRIPADSEFGALEGMVKGRAWVIGPWVLIALAALGAMFWSAWWPL